MEATVFSAYETSINTAILEESVNNYSISSGSNISIDNRGNDYQYPKLSITSDSSNITEVSSGGNTVQLDETISTGDTLLLDFKNQEYTLNGTSIIENLTFPDNDRPILDIDSFNDISITFTNNITVDVTYEDYNDIITNEFVQDFRVSVDKSYLKDRKFKKKDANELFIDSKNYNVSLSNLAYDWELFNAIEQEKPIRITYEEDHTSESKNYIKHLIGIKFNTYERYYRDSTGFIFESLVGEGTKLL